VSLFQSMDFADLGHDVLTIRLQPDEGFSLAFDVKRPGSPLVLEKAPLEFRYGQAFGRLPDAYVTLLLDVVQGDQTLFVHADEVEDAWRLYDPLLDGQTRVRSYPAGSWGPREAEELLARDGRVWRTA
jgi:glucose-6-phosphate 1-dehydrogenase